MLSEKQFEDIICKYPELIEEGLVFKGRQIHVYRKIMDVLFEDKFGQKLIVELKVGPIDRKHIGQVMEYEGSVLSVEDPTARIMLVGNRVPPNLKKALDHHGIEHREMSLTTLIKFLESKKDKVLIDYFAEIETTTPVKTLDKTRRTKEVEEKSMPEDNIDWRRHESHLSIIDNKKTIELISYLREKIKNLGEDSEETGRRSWMQYRIRGGRFFCSIGEIRQDGTFTIGIHLPVSQVEASGYEVKSWGAINWASIKVGPDTPYKVFDDIVKTIAKSYDDKKGAVGSQKLRNVLVKVAEDRPVQKGTVPGRSDVISHIGYDELSKNPYVYTQLEFYHQVHHIRRNKPDLKIESYNIKRNSLCKKYGWGIHINELGKLAIFGCETEDYKKLLNNILVRKVNSFKKHRV